MIVKKPTKSINSLAYFAVIFLVLLITAVLVKHNPFQKPTASGNLLTDFTKEKVVKIQLISAGESKPIVLEKSGQDWILLEDSEEATKAALGSVTGFIQTLSGLNKDELVSQNKDKQADFDLTEDKASQIIITLENRELVLLVGKRSADFAGNYIRVKDDIFVYKTNSPMTSYFSGSTFRQ